MIDKSPLISIHLKVEQFQKACHQLTWMNLVSVYKYLRSSRNVRKRTFGHVCPAKFQISMRLRAVWSESSLGAFWIGKDAKFLHEGNEDWTDCTQTQADLSLRRAHTSQDIFSYVAVLLMIRKQNANVWRRFQCNLIRITKTCLFKYIENFTTKKWKFSDKKILIFFIFLLKT